MTSHAGILSARIRGRPPSRPGRHALVILGLGAAGAGACFPYRLAQAACGPPVCAWALWLAAA
jgi:hypothetical protein